ncbi:ATP-binding cassette domain-containing protein [Candidatus Bathyarchaeota archaeon]|nr:ATP-binding cassette domain-containing protein [Candidatus Bathyarchaeota archaeon]
MDANKFNETGTFTGKNLGDPLFKWIEDRVETTELKINYDGKNWKKQDVSSELFLVGYHRTTFPGSKGSYLLCIPFNPSKFASSATGIDEPIPLYRIYIRGNEKNMQLCNFDVLASRINIISMGDKKRDDYFFQKNQLEEINDLALDFKSTNLVINVIARLGLDDGTIFHVSGILQDKMQTRDHDHLFINPFFLFNSNLAYPEGKWVRQDHNLDFFTCNQIKSFARFMQKESSKESISSKNPSKDYFIICLHDHVIHDVVFIPKYRDLSRGKIALTVENLTVWKPSKRKFLFFGPKIGGDPIIENLSFQTKDGELVGVLGESGAGKTTTIKAIINDQELRWKGRIRIFGLDNKSSKINPLFGYVPQSLDRMYGSLTVLENIVHFGRQYNIPDEDLYENGRKLLVNLSIFEKANQKVSTLSGGEKRRCNIAIGLAHSPRILILDEPTSGLDPLRRHELWSYIVRANQILGTTVIVITHFPEEVEYCDKVAVFMRPKKDKTRPQKKSSRFVYDTPFNLKAEGLPGDGFATDIILQRWNSKAIELIPKIDGVEETIVIGERIRVFRNINASVDEIIKEIKEALAKHDIGIKSIVPRTEIEMDNYFILESGEGAHLDQYLHTTDLGKMTLDIEKN